MIASPPRPRPAPATTAPIRPEGPCPSGQEVRQQLLRIGRHVSLLRTIAAAPRPADRTGSLPPSTPQQG